MNVSGKYFVFDDISPFFMLFDFHHWLIEFSRKVRERINEEWKAEDEGKIGAVFADLDSQIAAVANGLAAPQPLPSSGAGVAVSFRGGGDADGSKSGGSMHGADVPAATPAPQTKKQRYRCKWCPGIDFWYACTNYNQSVGKHAKSKQCVANRTASVAASTSTSLPGPMPQSSMGHKSPSNMAGKRSKEQTEERNRKRTKDTARGNAKVHGDSP